MENSFYTPSEVIKSNIKSAVAKANLPLAKMILLGLMAGAFIAFGGAASSVAAHGVADVGLARSIAGAIFPVGLMLVVFTGSELFTGNSLMIMAVIDKKITLLKMIRNLVVVYFANFIGALIIDVLVFLSGQFDFSGGGLGAYTIKVALAKTSIAPVTAVISGILCNILVCLAIVLAGTAKDSIGRIFDFFLLRLLLCAALNTVWQICFTYRQECLRLQIRPMFKRHMSCTELRHSSAVALHILREQNRCCLLP